LTGCLAEVSQPLRCQPAIHLVIPSSRYLLSVCAARVPEHARHQVRVECQIAPRHLTIVERRAPWREDFGPDWTRFPIARLRYSAAGKSWTLYWRDRNLPFHLYDLLAPSNRVDDLLNEIDRDPICIFWG
jgi:Protein of unknown function (DUF3024)